jgi:hypothetical protein
MRKLTAALLSSATLALTACTDPHAASGKLQPLMTEEQVVQAVGANPDSVTLSTCGTLTAQPWPCKTFRYHQGMSALFVTFHQQGSYWVVNNWSVY